MPMPAACRPAPGCNCPPNRKLVSPPWTDARQSPVGIAHHAQTPARGFAPAALRSELFPAVGRPSELRKGRLGATQPGRRTGWPILRAERYAAQHARRRHPTGRRMHPPRSRTAAVKNANGLPRRVGARARCRCSLPAAQRSTGACSAAASGSTPASWSRRSDAASSSSRSRGRPRGDAPAARRRWSRPWPTACRWSAVAPAGACTSTTRSCPSLVEAHCAWSVRRNRRLRLRVHPWSRSCAADVATVHPSTRAIRRGEACPAAAATAPWMTPAPLSTHRRPCRHHRPPGEDADAHWELLQKRDDLRQPVGLRGPPLQRVVPRRLRRCLQEAVDAPSVDGATAS
jgi:hypothetical protein